MRAAAATEGEVKDIVPAGLLARAQFAGRSARRKLDKEIQRANHVAFSKTKGVDAAKRPGGFRWRPFFENEATSICNPRGRGARCQLLVVL